MKNNILSILTVSLLLLTSCQDFLTEEPKLSMSNQIALSDYNGLDQATAGAYAMLGSSAWYGSDFIIRNEMMSPNGRKHIGTEWEHGYFRDMYNLSYTADETSPLWGTAYAGIAAVNNILAAQVPADPQDLANVRAECLFLRAIAHFDLVRTFAMPYNYTPDHSHLGVPYIKTLQQPSDMPVRNTVKEVYDNIIADLLEAESLIDPAYVRKGEDPKAFVSLEAIQALLCRAYLYTEQWQLCADYAKKIIDSGKFNLWTAEELTDAACYKAAQAEEGDEVILEIVDLASNSVRSDLFDVTSCLGAYADAGCSKDLVNLYEEGDVRKSLFISKSGVDWTMKYSGKGLTKPDYNNIIVMRYSEVLLNLAEAVSHHATGDGIGALEAIAEARGAEPQLCNASGVALERRKELAWEAHLWFDLARTGADLVKGDDYVGAPDAKTVPAGDFRWAMPIPQRELTANTNLVQNKGY